MKGEMQQYELTFILGEKATPEDGTKMTATVTKLITKLGGSVTKEELWGRRELAYEIKHNRTGFYVTLWIDLPSDKVNDLERELRFDEAIIRFLTTKAYTTAQPGTLYPVAEEEKTEKAQGRTEKEEKGSAEEMLRRSTGSSKDKAAEPAKSEKKEDELPEEQRLEKLDEALEVMLKDEE